MDPLIYSLSFFVLDLFKGVIFPARAAIELHATSRARQAYAPPIGADAVTRGSAGQGIDRG